MTSLVAIDGGKSGLRIRVADSTGVRNGTGPGFVYVDEAHDIGAIVESITTARDEAFHQVGGWRPGAVSVAVAGLTGLPGVAAERARLVAALRTVLAPEVLLIDDALIAHAGAVAGPGTMVCVGTGTVVLGISPMGGQFWADRLGPMLGDRGSAHAIGRAGLRAAAAARDRVGPATVLTNAWVAELGGEVTVSTLQQFYRTGATVSAVSAFAVHVARAATAGDQVAEQILRAAATDLAESTAVVAEQVPGHPVSYSGQMLTADPLLRELLIAALDEKGLVLTPPRGDALTGGLALAGDIAAGRMMDRSFYATAIQKLAGENSC